MEVRALKNRQDAYLNRWGAPRSFTRGGLRLRLDRSGLFFDEGTQRRHHKDMIKIHCPQFTRQNMDLAMERISFLHQ